MKKAKAKTKPVVEPTRDIELDTLKFCLHLLEENFSASDHIKGIADMKKLIKGRTKKSK